jgi:hypothetical protein
MALACFAARGDVRQLPSFLSQTVSMATSSSQTVVQVSVTFVCLCIPQPSSGQSAPLLETFPFSLRETQAVVVCEEVGRAMVMLLSRKL